VIRQTRAPYNTCAKLELGDFCDVIRYSASGLEIGFVLEMQDAAPSFSFGSAAASTVQSVYTSVADRDRRIKDDGNWLSLEGRLLSPAGDDSGVRYRLEIEREAPSTIGKVTLFGRSEFDDRPVTLRFVETRPFEAVLEYRNDPTCYAAPYQETPLVLWRTGERGIVTCFGNGNVRPYAFRDRVHSATYFASEFEFILAEYNIGCRIPPIAYNTLVQETGGMLDQDMEQQRLPEDYEQRLRYLQNLGVDRVILHSPWQKLHGLWEPRHPELYWSIVEYAHQIGLNVLAYWNPNAFETPHAFEDDILFTWPGLGPDWGKTLRMADVGRPGGEALARRSLHDWLETNRSLDGIYIDLFWSFGDRSQGLIRHSFPQVERLSRWCIERLREWREDFILMFNARYYGPPSMFRVGEPLFGEWTDAGDEVVESGRIFGGANMWPIIGLGDESVGLDFVPITDDNMRAYRNQMILSGAFPYIQERLIDHPIYYSYLKHFAGLSGTLASFARMSSVVGCGVLSSAIYDTEHRTLVFLLNTTDLRAEEDVSLDVSGISRYPRRTLRVEMLDDYTGRECACEVGSDVNVLLDPLHAAVVIME